jgi:hypothetical protein
VVCDSDTAVSCWLVGRAGAALSPECLLLYEPEEALAPLNTDTVAPRVSRHTTTHERKGMGVCRRWQSKRAWGPVGDG